MRPKHNQKAVLPTDCPVESPMRGMWAGQSSADGASKFGVAIRESGAHVRSCRRLIAGAQSLERREEGDKSASRKTVTEWNNIGNECPCICDFGFLEKNFSVSSEKVYAVEQSLGMGACEHDRPTALLPEEHRMMKEVNTEVATTVCRGDRRRPLLASDGGDCPQGSPSQGARSLFPEGLRPNADRVSGEGADVEGMKARATSRSRSSQRGLRFDKIKRETDHEKPWPQDTEDLETLA